MQGVVGVYSHSDASTKGQYILYGVQHRGQESSGVTAASNHSMRTWKAKGLISNVLDKRYTAFTHPDDYVIIGAASGENTDNGYTPIESQKHPRYKFSLALDGFFPDKQGSNEDVIKHTILANLESGMSFFNALKKTMRTHRGSYYSLVMAVWDKEKEKSTLIAARDERGIRPLYMAKSIDGFYIASESAPIDVMENMGYEFIERGDVTPGSLVMITDNKITTEQVLESSPAHCVFEWVYFGRPDSVVEGKTVHIVRKRLGHGLVDIHDLNDEYQSHKNNGLVVIPVPDSGRSVSTGVAEALDVTADEGVIKNAYLGRTYIIDDPDYRKVASDLKHNIIRKTVEGKKVVLSDDSIVRGTVSESIAKNLRQAGATEVDFLVSYAPIFYPCFSDPADKPLAAKEFKGKSLEEIGELVAGNLPSIDNVRYNSVEKVLWAVDLPPEHICTYCVSGCNPFK
ncbi:amidophosphoribosyltransferase [Thermoproteota archaeon]